MLREKRRRTGRFAVGNSLAAASLFLAMPVVAQEPPARSTNPADIVVLGRKDRDKQIRDFVRGMTPASSSEALARWDGGKSCPQTVGLALADTRAITERLRRVAAAAGISLAPAECRQPNVLVIFATDKHAVIDLLRKRAPWLFLDIHGDPINLPEKDGPAVAWHVEGFVDRDGRPLNPSGDGPLTLASIIAPSRIEVTARPVYLMSIVVIESSAASGLTPTQLADYAAMRAFSDADPALAAKSGAPTILAILDAPIGSETPRSLRPRNQSKTAWACTCQCKSCVSRKAARQAAIVA